MQAADSKVLFIDSYHAGFAWSDGITAAIEKTLAGKAELKIYRMDTKRNGSEDFKVKAAAEAKGLIESWKPDVVIAADDNASKYLIKPNYIGSSLPFVFCGVNWDCSGYGFPAKNICGMEEVSLIKPLIAQLKNFAEGDRIGYLSSDSLSAKKNADNYESKFGLKLVRMPVSSVDAWKAAFKEAQGKVDMLILDNPNALKGWDEGKMKAFTLAHTKIPTGSIDTWIAPYCLMSYTKLASEQGEWAANQALAILGGKSPADIGVTQNKKGKIVINMPIARKIKARIPLKTLKIAEKIK